MKTLKTLLPLAYVLLLPLTVFAAPIAYPFRVTDNSGALVAGATVAIGATALTSGSATTVPAAAGEKLLSTNAAPAATVSVTLLDYGTGDYALVYDPAVNGELYVPLTVSKAGSTITGGAALIALVAAADSSTIVGVNTTTLSTNTLATGINTQTAKIATNAADSPNEVAAQSTTTSTSTAVAALPAANATAVWGATTRALTDKANFALVSTEYANIAAQTSTYGFDGPPAGTILTLTITRNSSSQPVLNWVADPAATAYKVMRSVDGVNYTVIATPAVGTLTYTDTARPANATVYYHIISIH